MKTNVKLKKHLILCICTLVPLGLIIRSLLFKRTEAASVAIIGGADGPTALFIASKSISNHYLYLTLGILAIIVVLFGITKTRSKK